VCSFQIKVLIVGILLLSASALRIPFLDPYLKSVGSNFRRGANFASSGATACNSTTFSPFSLSTQLSQFRQFKSDVLATRRTSQAQTLVNIPLEDDFRKALYIIAVGGNDILKWSVTRHLPLEEVEAHVPEISWEILRVVEVRIPVCFQSAEFSFNPGAETSA
jgi:hypothetical protein